MSHTHVREALTAIITTLSAAKSAWSRKRCAGAGRDNAARSARTAHCDNAQATVQQMLTNLLFYTRKMFKIFYNSIQIPITHGSR